MVRLDPDQWAAAATGSGVVNHGLQALRASRHQWSSAVSAISTDNEKCYGEIDWIHLVQMPTVSR
jgi:hypothetical protein